jgi:outer membrane receptor protein involved in Fe transport
MHLFRYALGALPFVAALWGQSTGSILLTVRDASGAPVAAAGKIEGPGLRIAFNTAPNGERRFRQLTPGNYQVEIEKSGFANEKFEVPIAAGETVARSITLSIASGAFHVDVVAVTPLAGTDLPVEQIAAPVQLLDSHDIADTASPDMSDLLNRKLDAVNVVESQGNSFQSDLNYRGYTASPLLGTPEGLSVYVDGVRMNQPFGDVVSWDLIPMFAVSEAALMPGSNPLFGLNTQGGALSIETKSGQNHPGTSLEAGGGSYGRRSVVLEHGGSSARGFNWYVGGNLLHDDGWREASGSDVRQTVTRLGWLHNNTALTLSLSYADNVLNGVGPQDIRLLSLDYKSIYTKPDTTWNHAPFANLGIRHSLGPRGTLSANGYFRYIRADTFNSDLNENSLDESVYQPSAADIAALTAAGYTDFPLSGASAVNTPFPKWRCIAQVLQHDEALEKCNALETRSYTQQHNYGYSVQAAFNNDRGNGHNSLTLGTMGDFSGVTFRQNQQFAYLNPDRSVTGVNGFLDGSTNRNGDPVDTRVNLHGVPRTLSLFGIDTFSPGARWTFTVSGRFNHTSVRNRDRIPGGALDGDYTFTRFNPAAGITWKVSSLASLYGSYAESNRAPTSIELGCADPINPCHLPNSLVSDPPLRQVVTRTIEAGFRGRGERGIDWKAGWFFGENDDDLLFVASPQSGNGYFKNFGKTRRDGLEASLGGRMKWISLGGGFTLLNASYQSPETINGSANSFNSVARAGQPGFDGLITILPGNRIPQIPQNMLKAWVELEPVKKLSINVDFRAVGQSYARGNENNLSQPDGKYYFGSGTSPGYGVLDTGVRYRAHKRVELFAEINNALNHHYYTGAALAVTGLTPQGSFIARPYPAVGGEFPLIRSTFYSAGAPIRVWGGMRVSF